MEDSLSVDTYYILKGAYGQIRKDLHNRLADSGITWPQFHALWHVGEQGTPLNELARELDCNASNITGLIDRMVENNWVYREHSLEDRRSWLIKLTEEGTRLKARLIPEHRGNIRERMAVLSREELETLKSLLIKLKDAEIKEKQP